MSAAKSDANVNGHVNGTGSTAVGQGPKIVPLTCHGHSRPVTHLSFSPMVEDDQYFLISACKDGNPMLRDGVTGDWIGTFVGHKGAVWQARLSGDAALAATASADFTCKIWDTFSGENIETLTHGHIVRTVHFDPDNSQVVTGGPEKKLRIFDLAHPANPVEIGPGEHEGTIRNVVWSEPTTVVSASEDRKIRWFDTRSRNLIETFSVDSAIGSCEVSSGGNVLCATAGKTVYFFDARSRRLLKSATTQHDVSSVGLHADTRKFIAGGSGDTWVRLYDFDSVQELDLYKGHHGPVWSVAFSPDGKLYATGSEDGTIKLWKYGSAPYGLWR